MLESSPRPLPPFLKERLPPGISAGWNALSLPVRVPPPTLGNQKVIDLPTIRILFANTEAPEDFTKQFLRFHLPCHFADGIECYSQIDSRKFRALTRT